MIKIKISWGKEKLELEADLNGTVSDLRKTIYEATQVLPAKQKLILKGNILQGSTIMLIGQPESNAMQIEKPAEKTIFYEDLTPQERAKLLKEKTGIILPSGLVNLGNTCYFNSVIQCLKRVNELKTFLLKTEFNVTNHQALLAKWLKDLFYQLESKGEAVTPSMFLHFFRQQYPQFAETNKQGQPRQQDSDECFQTILSTIQPACQYKNLLDEDANLVQDLFEVQFECTLQNLQNQSEQVNVTKETNKKLMCIIDHQDNPIDQLIDGIRKTLVEQIEKRSEIDNQNNIYLKTSRISKLPSYLTVQFVRFFWKQEYTFLFILKSVAFPKILDLSPYCTEELQKSLQFGKEYEKKKLEERLSADKDRFEEYKKQVEADKSVQELDSRKLYQRFKEQQKESIIKEEDENTYRQHGKGLDAGNYQLVAVLTHKGRDASSGHYMAYVHSSGDVWACYDDDYVTEKKLENILELKGGGDRDMAYYLIYRKLEVI